jgi:putative protease
MIIMEVEVGKVTHYFTKISVAVVELSDKLRIGDKIRIKGATTDFVQEVKSMQINHKPVKEANPGDDIGLLVEDRVREGDIVYKIVEEETGKKEVKKRGRKKK